MSAESQTQLEPSYDKEFCEQARALWCSDARLIVHDLLSGGYSGAAVLLVDVDRDRLNSALAADEVRGGTYVLKLDVTRAREGSEADEAQRHTDAMSWAPKFSDQHVPPLVRIFRAGNKIALLYQIAGNSTTRLSRSDLLAVGLLESRMRLLGDKLLSEFNSSFTISRDYTVGQLLKEWLGKRIDPVYKTRLRDLAEEICGEKRAFVRATRLLANPLKLAQSAIGSSQLRATFCGVIHGDLHLENIFWDRARDSLNFWMIDFAFSRPSPLFFDHAYLELSLLLQKFEQMDPARLLNLLDCLLQPEGTVGAKFISAEDLGTLSIARELRNGIDDWQKLEQELRVDSVSDQRVLARIAVGLNWANKPISDDLRHLAFLYASHATKEYLELHHPDEWRAWAVDAEYRHSVDGATVDDLAWQQLWSEMGGFSAEEAHYVLISGLQTATDDLASFGFLPWSAVLDFDVNSDSLGLFKRVRPNLEQQRAVQFFGQSILPTGFSRGVAWMMANGSTTLNEPSPNSLAEWRRQFKGVIRQLACDLRCASAPLPVRILVLPGAVELRDRIERAIEEIVDELGAAKRVIVATLSGPMDWQLPDVDKVLSVSTESLARRAASIFGITSAERKGAVPGQEGPVQLDMEKIRSFEEDFEVLHSDILSSGIYEEGADAFWRGGPPSWRDIESSTPVERDLEKKLLQILRSKLKDSTTTKVEMFHTPGAGGTTVCLMAAWAMRRQFPTVVLRRNSRQTADRISWLFHLVRLPILVIADTAILSRAEADELRRRLANDNTRAVLLHAIRVSQEVDTELGLFDPMSFREADAFRAAFAKRTNDQRKRVLLGQISRDVAKEIEPLRSPFFFGLVTYGENFTHLASYVSVHVAAISFVGRKILSYLALVARFSQAPISSGLIRGLANLDPAGHRPLSEVLGNEPNRLVVEWSGLVKLVHPLIAEEILRQFGGGDTWKHSLADVCTDFIRDILRAAGSVTDEVHQIFFHLFIEREEWTYDDSATQRGHFSDLVQTIPSEAGQRRVLELLAQECPTEAHYQNHLGRHYVYSLPPNYRRAEECLQKAIELSDGRDSLHHHALGLVRRFWIQQKIRDLRAKAEIEVVTLTPKQILDEVASLADGAFAEFDVSRRLRPDVNHGYITHIQTILYIAEALNRNGGDDFSLLSQDRGAVGGWLRTHIGVVEGLLGRLSQMRGAEPETSYEIGCLTRIAKLYGNYEIINTWEGMLGVSSEPLHLRRALASLYFARRHRNWATVPNREIRRIVELTETNLRADPTDDRDIRMWFQAIRRLPEFNYYEAIDRLEAWAARTNAVDAHYYLYILLFLRWKGDGEDAEKAVQTHLEASAKGRTGARGYSYEWLAPLPKWCPLVSASELGEWDKQKGFFRNIRGLAFAEGTIETIKPQAGTIRLGRYLRAFFVPPAEIRETSHINSPVHFHLGFSYEGFRAWNVRLGAKPSQEHPL